MTIEAVFASALPGPENSFIHALVIRIEGEEPIRFCDGFKDRMLGDSDGMRRYACGSIEFSLPALNDSGQQSLRFAVPNITGEIRKIITRAIYLGKVVTMEYAEYLAKDHTAPARRPIKMQVTGAQLEGIIAVFQGSYKNLLSLAFGDKNRYTAETAPGIMYT